MALRGGPYFGSTGGQIHVPDYGGIAEAAKIRAGGQAAFGKAIGQAIGDFGKSFFEKKKQKKLAESMADNPVVMEALYGTAEGIRAPANREQRVKDVTASIRSGGGTEEFIRRIDRLKAEQQQQQRLTAAEGRAASAEQRAQGLYDQGQRDREGMKEFLKLIFPKPVEPTRPEYFQDPRFTDPAQKPPERRVPEGGFRETRPTINVATGEVTPPVPPTLAEGAAELSPEGQKFLLTHQIRQQEADRAASTAGLATKIKVNEELRKQAGERRIEATLDFGTIEIDPKGKPVHRGLSLGSGNEARALTGSFSDKEEAAKAKNRLGMLNDSLDKINQLQEMARQYEGASVWTGGTSVEDKQAAENLAQAIQGQIREEILGPGTVTDPERAILKQLVPSGNVFFSYLSGEDGAKELENLKNNLMSNFERYLEAWGISTGAPRGGTELPRTQSRIRNLQVTEF